MQMRMYFLTLFLSDAAGLVCRGPWRSKCTLAFGCSSCGRGLMGTFGRRCGSLFLMEQGPQELRNMRKSGVMSGQ